MHKCKQLIIVKHGEQLEDVGHPVQCTPFWSFQNVFVTWIHIGKGSRQMQMKSDKGELRWGPIGFCSNSIRDETPQKNGWDNMWTAPILNRRAAAQWCAESFAARSRGFSAKPGLSQSGSPKHLLLEVRSGNLARYIRIQRHETKQS